jgi:hypothetical protein
MSAFVQGRHRPACTRGSTNDAFKACRKKRNDRLEASAGTGGAVARRCQRQVKQPTSRVAIKRRANSNARDNRVLRHWPHTSTLRANAHRMPQD